MNNQPDNMPDSLNQDLSLDRLEDDLAPALRSLLRAPEPAGLADRIFQATAARQVGQAAAALDAPLSQALKVPAPAGLETRIFKATVNRLPGRVVIGRIGFSAAGGRMAMAAALLLAVTLGWWFNGHGNAMPGPGLTDVQQVMIDLDNIDSDMNTLALALREFETNTLAYTRSPLTSQALGNELEELDETLLILESHSDAF